MPVPWRCLSILRGSWKKACDYGYAHLLITADVIRLSGQYHRWMGHRPSCRSCRHSSPPDGGQAIWCQLRQLAIHPDLAGDLWCHHWTARPPRLPALGPQSAEAAEQPRDAQLSLGGMLQEI
jgi:hypothetical protein